MMPRRLKAKLHQMTACEGAKAGWTIASLVAHRHAPHRTALFGKRKQPLGLESGEDALRKRSRTYWADKFRWSTPRSLPHTNT
jgi:hypothetical protein